MGMYTHCRGWIKIDSLDYSKKEFNELMEKAEKLSPRSSQCVSSTIYNMGFDFSPYIFIGGQIKNYDDDWNIFLDFLFNNLKVDDYNIKTKYEEYDTWTDYKNALVLADEGDKE